jgi:hypothetical protein
MAIAIGVEDRLLAVTARTDVVQRTRKLNTWTAGHGDSSIDGIEELDRAGYRRFRLQLWGQSPPGEEA